MAYLLDTNVVCEATAKQPAARVLVWIEAHAHECFLSTISLGEISLNDGKEFGFYDENSPPLVSARR